MAGTVSASWAGEERAAILPWRQHAATGKTTTEVGHEHMWYVRLHRACKPCAVKSQLGWILQGRLFSDSWWRTDSEVCLADSARVDLNLNETDWDLGWQG